MQDQRLATLLNHRFYAQRIRANRGRPSRPAFKAVEGCIVYDGSLSGKGYARRGASELVHRAAWQELVGPIPPQHDIHHLCRRKDCARIDHLVCLSKETHALVEGRPLKLRKTDVEEILRDIVAKTPHAVIAAKFGVVRPYISLIKYGQRWARVVRPFWESRAEWPEGQRSGKAA